jgi:hypothetical protein
MSILFETLCDQSSSYFALHGASPHLMQNMLASHCIPFSGLSYNLCHQALCHHLINGLCACGSGSLCALVSGGLPPLSFALLVGEKILEVVSDPLFPLQILQQIALGLGFHSSRDQKRSNLLSLF